jgi:hypothetical protein
LIDAPKELGMPDPGSPFAQEYRAVTLGMQRCSRSGRVFDATTYDAGAIAQARAMWRGRMTAEYCSASVFSGLALQLMEANAPMDCTAVVLRLAQGEVWHAALCGETLAALGDTPVAPVPADIPPDRSSQGHDAGRARSPQRPLRVLPLGDGQHLAFRRYDEGVGPTV